MSSHITDQLSAPLKLTNEQIATFRENGFIKLKEVFSAEVLGYMDKIISSEVERLTTDRLPLDQRDTYGKAFLQVMNLWTRSEEVKEIVFSRRLAGLAAQLLEIESVRLYHDQALYKEPGGGHTPWHADQYYWPLATDRTVTAWIPLQATPPELGPLEFSSGSYKLTTGRDKPISDESQELLRKTLESEGYHHIAEPFDAGEISFHLGWLFHRAAPNRTNRMRKVMTVIYMDSLMRLKEPANDHQINDWNTWCPGARIGEIIDTELNPVLC